MKRLWKCAAAATLGMVVAAAIGGPVQAAREKKRDRMSSKNRSTNKVLKPSEAMEMKANIKKEPFGKTPEGEEVDLAPRKITVHHLEVLEWAPPEVVVDVHCSSGTYVRSLANDVGNALGCGGYLVGLRRTKSGRFSLRDATPLRKLQEAFHAGNWYQLLIPAAEALGDWSAIELDPDQVEAVKHGHRIPAAEDASGMVRGVSMAGELVALLELDTTTHEWQPKKVFFS